MNMPPSTHEPTITGIAKYGAKSASLVCRTALSYRAMLTTAPTRAPVRTQAFVERHGRGASWIAGNGVDAERTGATGWKTPRWRLVLSAPSSTR